MTPRDEWDYGDKKTAFFGLQINSPNFNIQPSSYLISILNALIKSPGTTLIRVAGKQVCITHHSSKLGMVATV